VTHAPLKACRIDTAAGCQFTQQIFDGEIGIARGGRDQITLDRQLRVGRNAREQPAADGHLAPSGDHEIGGDGFFRKGASEQRLAQPGAAHARTGLVIVEARRIRRDGCDVVPHSNPLRRQSRMCAARAQRWEAACVGDERIAG
jgi:hypothetical protein